MSLVDLTVDGAVALVRLNRPPVNALSEELSVELGEAFDRCADPEIRAVVVTGQPHFAAGADIKGFQAAYDSGVDEKLAGALLGTVAKLESLEKPTIAAIHGYALGGGLELAMGCDFRYLAVDAKVGQPEILLGIIPGAGGTQRLPRIVGYQRAKEIVFSGRQVDAEEAERIGLADRVAPTEELLDLALADAGRWAAGPTRALAAAKRALNDGWGHVMGQALMVEAGAFQDCFWTDDAKEGVAAFIEKRKAEFTGR
ncbi:MAG: enoyl-CoA hydratase-related protein [Acidimicrobiia bacterium]|nr:enoyl-CoA hydratase-related protein [Acidimicrobiia bacterium]MDH4306747.1 enoyl-CoA hydratase-related protein [Acidimicrobiia bacterium]MDH5294133.1 enoyl-CoA hydratase-related protein [Acidimicrobiia bacterium]